MSKLKNKFDIQKIATTFTDNRHFLILHINYLDTTNLNDLQNYCRKNDLNLVKFKNNLTKLFFKNNTLSFIADSFGSQSFIIYTNDFNSLISLYKEIKEEELILPLYFIIDGRVFSVNFINKFLNFSKQKIAFSDLNLINYLDQLKYYFIINILNLNKTFIISLNKSCQR